MDQDDTRQKTSVRKQPEISRQHQWFPREMKRRIERGTDRFKTYIEKGNRRIAAVKAQNRGHEV